MTPTASITRASVRDISKPLNILCADTHERYQSVLANTNAQFYSLYNDNFCKWKSHYAPIPENYVQLDKLPDWLDFDLVLSQNKFGQYQILSQIAHERHLPLVSLEHTLPMAAWNIQQRAQLRDMRGDINLFISAFSREAWGFNDVPNTEVIHHAVDSRRFCSSDVERQPYILSVVNDWLNRDWCCGFKIWEEAVQGLPVRPVGDTPGLSKPAASTEELIGEYQHALVFVNTSTVSPIPTSLLEAMSCGCVCVSLANCMIPDIIQHGVNGFLGNNPAELRAYLQICLDPANLEQVKSIGEQARKTIQERFSVHSFLSSWNDVFRRASETVYTGDKW